MRPPYRPTSRAAAGITLTEVCVLLAVVAVLVCLMLPGATSEGGVNRGRMATQNAKGLGMLFGYYASDNDGHFPDGPTSTALFADLLQGKYLQNGDALFIPSTPGKTSKWNGAGAITAANICWDVVGCDDPKTGQPIGVTIHADAHLPVLITTGNAPGMQIGPPGSPPELTMSTNGVFGLFGVVVARRDGSAQYVGADPAHPGKTLGFMPKDYADATPYVVRNP